METTSQNPTWKEQFKAAHSIENLPPDAELRRAFLWLLDHRAAVRDYYREIPAERFDEGIGKGDSPKKELIHQIGNTALRSKALSTGSIPNWIYQKVDPEDFEKLQALSKDQLIEKLDWTTEELYKALTSGDIKKSISLPYGQSVSATDNV